MTPIVEQARCIRDLGQINPAEVCAICFRSDNSIVLLQADAADLGKSVVLLYTQAVSDAQLHEVMNALGIVIRGPFAANGPVTRELLQECVAHGAYLLVDYVFDRCHVPWEDVRIKNIRVQSFPVQ